MASADILKSHVPSFLLQDNTFNNIYNTQGIKLDTLNDDLGNLQAQCFVDTATWGLGMWESFLGIKTDENKSFIDRRSFIKSKIRGVGTVTVEMMKNVANSFKNGDVDIIENTAPNTFTVKFIGSLGIPPNLQDCKNAIEDIKPAHLKVVYVFSYILIKDISNMILSQFKNTAINKFAF
jgi:hypothetical protein